MNKLVFRHISLLSHALRRSRFAILAVGTAVMLVIFAPATNAQTEAQSDVDDDKLAYVSQDNQLMLYDPRTRTETKLLNNVEGFKLSQDGRVAFRKFDESDTDLYVYDPATPAVDPVNISQKPAANNYAVAWSPDGRYLAFGSYKEMFDDTLYVWDGEAIINIMPDESLDTAAAFYVNWSNDGRLAFAVQYGWSNLDIPPEIYIWDGSTTTNLSQNPEGWDSSASWSSTGQLLFGSQRDGEGYLYVWDGESFKEGSPDLDSFIPVAPELNPASANWTDDGLISFRVEADSSPSGKKEIILWDLETETIVKQYLFSSEKMYSSLAEGEKVILSSILASGIPSFYVDIQNTDGEILFSTQTGEYSWSVDGYFAFCGIEKGTSKLLSLWNGQETWVVATTSYRPIQWQNGQDTFSCNNG